VRHYLKNIPGIVVRTCNPIYSKVEVGGWQSKAGTGKSHGPYLKACPSKNLNSLPSTDPHLHKNKSGEGGKERQKEAGKGGEGRKEGHKVKELNCIQDIQ
jgi:hypothetical protein